MCVHDAYVGLRASNHKGSEQVDLPHGQLNGAATLLVKGRLPWDAGIKARRVF